MKLIVKGQEEQKQEPVMLSLRQDSRGVIVEAHTIRDTYLCTVMKIGNDGVIKFPKELNPLKELGFITTPVGIKTRYGIN